MKLKTLAAAGLLALAAAPALGAGHFYVLGAIGQSRAEPNSGSIDDQFRRAGMTVTGSTGDDTGMAGKLQLGYQHSPYFAIEGGYIDLSDFNYSVGLAGGAGRANIDVSGWNLDILGTYPVGRDFGVFGKLGVLAAQVDTQVVGSGTGGAIDKATHSRRWRPSLGLGLAYQFMPRTNLRLEYQVFYNLADRNLVGETQVDVLSLGVSYRF